MWQLSRTVVLEVAAAASVDGYTNHFPRFEAAWLGVEWLLARTPQIGLSKTVGGREFFLSVRSGDVLAGTPAIAVVYEFTDDQVVVHDVFAWKEAESGE